MEAYKSYCPDCKKTYYWQGFKTGIGKTQQQLNEMKNKSTTCKHCNSTSLETTLDHDSEAGKQQYAIVQRTTKGSNPFTEHYSALMADVVDPDDESTILNTDFIDIIKEYDIILGGGEALSHCYANTFRDIFREQ